MTLIVGNVVDVGLAGLDGTLRVWAWFRPEEVGLIAPYRREWEITGGEIEAGVDVIPGPAVVEVDCGPSAYTSVEVTVPDAESVALKDLFEQVYAYTPPVVSEAYAERLRAEVAAVAAEESAGVALGAERGALAAESGAALSAATLSARVEQPGQDILYTSDGKPYFADPAQIENVPLTVDTSVGTRVMLGDEVVRYDSGWRNVSDDLASDNWDFSGQDRYGMWIKRTETEVSLAVNGIFAGHNFFVTRILPHGFRQIGPGTFNYADVGVLVAGPDVIPTGFTHRGHELSIRAVPAGTPRSIRGVIRWPTSESIPASLPGTPA